MHVQALIRPHSRHTQNTTYEHKLSHKITHDSALCHVFKHVLPILNSCALYIQISDCVLEIIWSVVNDQADIVWHNSFESKTETVIHLYMFYSSQFYVAYNMSYVLRIMRHPSQDRIYILYLWLCVLCVL